MGHADDAGRAELFDMRAKPQETVFRPGSRFHLFTILRVLGRGGMAEVYEVKLQGRHYALKVLQRRLQLDPSQLKRFESEGRFLLRVRHPNLVDVQDMGVHEGVFWIRMELLHGMDLREAIHRLAQMSVGLVGVWLRQMAYGAHQCHAFGVVHRDIKPENVMLLRPDGVKLLDLGVAKIDSEIITIEGGPEEGLRGTALYMSPEQVNNEKRITPAADVYGLALTGWEMLVGQSPWLLGGQDFELLPTLYKQVHEDVPPLHRFGFDRRLSRVFERALSKDWRKRQPDGLSFAEDLGEAIDDYLALHPDDDPNPGEPALAWLFGEQNEIPSFGTGPMAGRGANGVGPRPSAPMPVGPIGSANALPAAARPIPRFHTDPMIQVPLGWSAPLLVEPDVDPQERVTHLAPVPLGMRRFDTISLPPEHRDPSALRALAGYRPQGKKRGDVAPQGAPAVAVVPSERRPRARRGLELSKIALLASVAALWIVAARWTYLHGARAAAPPTSTTPALDAGPIEPAPASALPIAAAPPVDAGLPALASTVVKPAAPRGGNAGPPRGSKPAAPPPVATTRPPRRPTPAGPKDIF